MKDLFAVTFSSPAAPTTPATKACAKPNRSRRSRLVDTLCISALVLAFSPPVIIPSDLLSEAFTVSPLGKARRFRRIQSSIILRKSPIERVGPSDSDEVVKPWLQKEEDQTFEEMIEFPSMSLDELLRPSSLGDVNQMGPTALAYIGDVVFELFVRSRYVWPTRRTADLQEKVVGLVRAEFQSRLLAKMTESFTFSQREQQVLSRGRNSSTASSKNRRDPSTYQDATALEALLGYLYVSDRKRCEDVLNWMYAHLDQIDDDE